MKGESVMLNMLFALLMAGTFVYMLIRAKMPETRELLWLPAAVCGVELMTAGFLSVTKFPVIAVLLLALRLSLLGFCVLVMKRDAALARARRQKRAQLKRRLHAALNPPCEIPAGSTTAAITRDVCVA